MLVDFHMHTTFSDGRLSVPQLLDRVEGAGIELISITDHDELGALDVAWRENRKTVKIISGIELSSTYKEKDVHILGYGFDVHNKRLQEYVKFFKEERRSRIERMVKRCAQEGYDISYEDIIGRFGASTSFGRPHLANLLIEKGYAASIKEAFANILHPSSPCYVPKFQSQPQDMLDIIHEANGLAILAHPKLIKNDDYVKELLFLDFDGLEVIHSSHTEEECRKYILFAKHRALLMSAGSDFHGTASRFPQDFEEFPIHDYQVSAFIRALQAL